MYQSIGSNGHGSATIDKDAADVGGSKKDVFLRIYTTFSTITAICLFMVVSASMLFLVLDTSLSNMNSIVHLFLRIYGLIFMCLAFMCEMEWVEAIRQSTVFQNWLFRGLFYSFLGLFTFVEYQREDVAAVKYGWTIDSIAITLVGLGIAYTFMGALSCKKVKSERTIRYIQLLTQSELDQAA